jgi:hypothetical protein
MNEPLKSTDPDDVINEPVNATPNIDAQTVEEKKPGILKRFFSFLFNKDTSFGRFNKSFLRLLVAVLVLFAAGLLVTYFALYLPAKKQLAETSAVLETTTAQLTDTTNTLDEVDAALSDMTTAYDQLTADYAYATAQNQLLRMYSKVVDAQMLIKDKNYSEAKKVLAEARVVLDAALPEMQKVNADDADRMDARLDLVISEFGNDVKAAESDLGVMVTWIGEFDVLLQTEIDK